MLGLNYTWSAFKESSFEPHVAGMADLFERAAYKWFHLETYSMVLFMQLNNPLQKA